MFCGTEYMSVGRITGRQGCIQNRGVPRSFYLNIVADRMSYVGHILNVHGYKLHDILQFTPAGLAPVN